MNYFPSGGLNLSTCRDFCGGSLKPSFCFKWAVPYHSPGGPDFGWCASEDSIWAAALKELQGTAGKVSGGLKGDCWEDCREIARRIAARLPGDSQDCREDCQEIGGNIAGRIAGGLSRPVTSCHVLSCPVLSSV